MTAEPGAAGSAGNFETILYGVARPVRRAPPTRGKPLSGTEAAEVELINRAVPFARLEDEVAKTARSWPRSPAPSATTARPGRRTSRTRTT